MTKEPEPQRSKEQERQITSTIYMVQPDHFAFNPEAAKSNHDSKNLSQTESEKAIQQKAMEEFKGMVFTLQSHNINIVIGQNHPEIIAPDAVFPNNWFTTHEDGTLILYPMRVPNRRIERLADPDFFAKLRNQGQFNPKEIKRLDKYEETEQYLEGTGSLVLDRKNRIAYASESPRTTVFAAEAFANIMKYDLIPFHTTRSDNAQPYYHTNVVMSIGEGFAVVCPEVIWNPQEKNRVVSSLAQNHEVVEISEDQVHQFCGNILELDTLSGKPIIVMSDSAYEGFKPTQRETLQKYGKIVPVHIPTIEQVSGGSARCMIAEIFPNKNS